jgi:hypothetical protein
VAVAIAVVGFPWVLGVVMVFANADVLAIAVVLQLSTSMESLPLLQTFFDIPFATGFSNVSGVPVVVGVPAVVKIPYFYGVFTGSGAPSVGVSCCCFCSWSPFYG